MAFMGTLVRCGKGKVHVKQHKYLQLAFNRFVYISGPVV